MRTEIIALIIVLIIYNETRINETNNIIDYDYKMGWFKKMVVQ